jgi:glycosyltransferase involved in cell wall biosynthesis
MNKPLLTVLMSVKNGEPYLRETVESILDQTYNDFKFLILDNASTDNSRDIIRSFNDPHIRLIELPEDIGQVAALNKGLDMIDTPLVARMDADDISMPRRLERQVEFMNNHPEIGISGTYATAFEGKKQTRWPKPCTPGDVKARLLFGCCLAHPSVIIRKALLDKYHLRYDEQIGFSEDWDLWQRASRHFPLANIPGYLIKYRIHPESVSRKNVEPQKRADEQLVRKALEPLGLANHPLHRVHEEITLANTYNASDREPEFIPRVQEWFRVITAANQKTGIYNEKSLKKAVKGRLFMVLNANARQKGLVLKVFFKERLYREVGFIPSLKFLVHVIIFSWCLMHRHNG